MYLDILEFRIENKNNYLGKTVFENVVSDLMKNGLSVHKTTFRKKYKKQNKKLIEKP